MPDKYLKMKDSETDSEHSAIKAVSSCLHNMSAGTYAIVASTSFQIELVI